MYIAIFGLLTVFVLRRRSWKLLSTRTKSQQATRSTPQNARLMLAAAKAGCRSKNPLNVSTQTPALTSRRPRRLRRRSLAKKRDAARVSSSRSVNVLPRFANRAPCDRDRPPDLAALRNGPLDAGWERACTGYRASHPRYRAISPMCELSITSLYTEVTSSTRSDLLISKLLSSTRSQRCQQRAADLQVKQLNPSGVSI